MTLEERRELASIFVKESKLNFPTLLDRIDNKTSTDYASHPDRLYLVGKDGKIAWAGGKGPQGFDPDRLEKEIVSHMGE